MMQTKTAWDVLKDWQPRHAKQGQESHEKPFWMRFVAAPLRYDGLLVNLDHVRVFGASGALAGLLFGIYVGARTRRLQFLAENAHRLPKTVKGWFYYHRERNYQCLKAAADEGIRQAVRFGSVMGGFAAIETAIDLVRQREDVVSTLMAGVTSTLVFSLVYQLPQSSTRRALMFGVGISGIVGLLQDFYRRTFSVSCKYPTLEVPADVQEPG